LPEHTLEAKAYAHALRADYIEQDIVATRDDELIVMHDIHLDGVTNVADVYPERSRDDGRYYARDFDLAEIRNLVVWERRGEDGETAVFPNRYPSEPGRFRLSTLREEIRMIHGLNHSTGRNVGIYPEIKRPAWHRDEGFDISSKVVQLLDDLGYRSKKDRCYLQCFDAAEVYRIRHELGCQLRMVQLIGDNSWGEAETDFDELRTTQGLTRLAKTVDGVGPSLSHLVTLSEIDGSPVSLGFVSAAHTVGLTVHPYTFRAEQLVPGFNSMGEMVRWCIDELAIDGLFTDFPDQALAVL